MRLFEGETRGVFTRRGRASYPAALVFWPRSCDETPSKRGRTQAICKPEVGLMAPEKRRGPGRPALPWFRMHSGFSTCAKAQNLTDAEFRTWMIVIDQASQNTPRGRLPSVRAAAYRSGRPESHVKRLIKFGLIDEQPDGELVMHDWDFWQSRQSAYDPVTGGESASEAAVEGVISKENYSTTDARISEENPDASLAYLTSTTALSLPTTTDNGFVEEEKRAVEAEDATQWPRWKRDALKELRRARGFNFSDAAAGDIIDRAASKLAAHDLSVVSLCERLADWVNNPPEGVKRPRTLLPLVTRWADSEIDHLLGIQPADFEVPGLDRRKAEAVRS